MLLFAELKRGVLEYCANPILMIPSVLLAFAGLTIYYAMSFLQHYTPYASLVGVAVYILCFVLCACGQASMTMEVVMHRNPRLLHWRVGAKKYFSQVLWIGVVYVLISYLIWQCLVIAFGVVLFRPFGVPDLILGTLVKIFPFALVQTCVFLWLASLVIDNETAETSLGIVATTLLKNPTVFSGFFIVLFIISVAIEVVSMLYLVRLILMFFPNLSLFHVYPFVSMIGVSPFIPLMGSFFIPWWFMTIFSIYFGEQQPADLRQ